MKHHYWLIACGLLAASLASVTTADAAEPVITQSLQRLAETPPAAADSFDFIVTGDSEVNRMPPVQSEVFMTMLREFNLLEPALVVEVGDLILGGSADKVPEQWDCYQQAIAECKVPFFPVTGNHDISDALTQKLWVERMGPTHYSFTYGNSLFIALDSEEVNALDRLSDEQVAWLKGELDKTKASNIFIFLHQPYFVCEESPDKSNEAWERRWKYMADVMHGHPVRAVFAGHIHSYIDCGVRDGVHYVVSGGAASLSGQEDKGLFNHYLLVRVRGEKVSWSVIKPGAVRPSDVFTQDRAQELYRINEQLVSSPEILVKPGQMVDQDVVVRVDNPYDKAFNGTVTCMTPLGWKAEPGARAYTAPANGGVELTFRVSAESADRVRFPVPMFATRYLNGKYGPPVDVKSKMNLVPLAEASYAGKKVKIDGVLDEWKGAKAYPLTYTEGFKGEVYSPDNLGGEMRMMWNSKYLYLAFDVTDKEHVQDYAGDIVWLGDAIELGIDKWAWALSLTKHGPEVFSYIGEGTSAETVNTDVLLAVQRDGTHTRYEVAIPAAYVKPMALKKGSSFALRANICDRTESGKQHGLGLTPGGDGAPRVRTTLEKKSAKAK